jgi:hypothetical protein
MGERKKAHTNICVNFHYQWRKRSFHGCFSAFLCFSLLFSVVKISSAEAATIFAAKQGNSVV